MLSGLHFNLQFAMAVLQFGPGSILPVFGLQAQIITATMRVWALQGAEQSGQARENRV
jgi:hypothetical protein